MPKHTTAPASIRSAKSSIMTVHLVTFSDESMSHSREICHKSWLRHGGSSWWPFGPAVQYGFPEFASFPLNWFSRRGCGYWSWKPAIISLVMRMVKNDDMIVYADAGVEFINNVSHIIDRMDQDIFLFGNNWEHAHWCKRDVIEAIWPYRPQYPTTDVYRSEAELKRYYLEKHWEVFGKQVQASVIFFRVSDYSRAFVAEWLKWCLHRIRFSEGVCTDEWRYLIDDSPSIAPNHPEFREHRHDQAILTTMAYREGIKLHYWPATYNDGAFNYEKLPEYAGDDYPILFHHHRRRNHEWENAA